MKKILIITICIILFAGLTAGAYFGLKEEDFDKKVKEIDAKKLCEKETELGVKNKKCKGDENIIEIKDNDLIMLNKNLEVYRIKNG